MKLDMWPPWHGDARARYQEVQEGNIFHGVRLTIDIPASVVGFNPTPQAVTALAIGMLRGDVNRTE